MNNNTGHGHVWTRPDGLRMRCGGPMMCAVCAADFARYHEYTENMTKDFETWWSNQPTQNNVDGIDLKQVAMAAFLAARK